MAFFPKDEYVPRRGVAMKTRIPDVENLVGEHRDTKIAREVEIFVHSDFVLNKALDKNIPEINRMRTFDRRKGEHDVIAHTAQSNPKPAPRLRPDLSERALKKLHHPHDIEDQVRESAISMMANSPGLVQKLSKQGDEKWHKHMVQGHVAKHPSDGIVGFTGLGKASEDPPAGKQRVIRREYDPLKFKYPLQGERGEPAVGIHNLRPDEHPQGLGCVRDPYPVTAHEHFKYNDGISLENMMKKEIRHPHLHKFPDNFSAAPDHGDMPGLHGMGKSDINVHPTGKKYITPDDSIYSNFEAYQQSPKRKHQAELERIEHEQQLRNSTPANGHLSDYHHNRFNDRGASNVAGSGGGGSHRQSPSPQRDIAYYNPLPHNSPAFNTQPQIQYQQHMDTVRKAPHRVVPMKPNTLANQSTKYHASQSSWQVSPEPNRWVPGGDAGRTHFH